VTSAFKDLSLAPSITHLIAKLIVVLCVFVFLVQLYSWGNNDEKALGRTGLEYQPGPVEGLDGINIVRVVCSDSASFALSDAGKVYGCGTFRVRRSPEQKRHEGSASTQKGLLFLSFSSVCRRTTMVSWDSRKMSKIRAR